MMDERKFPKDTLDELFTYHTPQGDDQERYEEIRGAARHLASCMVECCPESADRTDAIRKVREAVMTANASIALRRSRE